MSPFRQFRNTEESCTLRVAAKVETEVIVKVVGAHPVALYNQLHILPNSVACCIDAIGVGYLSHKIRCAVHLATIYK